MDEVNKRLAQTKLPNGEVIEREWSPHERYMLYVRGFSDGAAVRAMSRECEGLGAYACGYDAGRRARNEAVAAYAKEIGYISSILRAEES